MSKTAKKIGIRLRRHATIRKKVVGTAARPRLCVFRSLGHIYAQVIDDQSSVTLASASSTEKALKEACASLVTVAIQRRPDVTARRLAVEEASLRQRLARREGMPVPSLNGFLTRDDGESGSRLGLGVSLPVALLDRNQGRVDREAASLERARIRLEAAQLAVRLEVREARLAYLSASEESARLESRVLEPARANIALVDSAYRAGKLGLPTLLLLRNQLVEAELDYWQAWQARREALLRLRAAVGLPAAPDDPTTTLPPKDTP